MRAPYFFGFILSFIAGVTFENVFDFGYALGVLCIVIALFVYLTRGHGSSPKNVLLVSLVFLGLSFGIFRVDVSQTNSLSNALSNFRGEVVYVHGLVLSEPDVRESYTNIVLEVRDVLYKNKETLVLSHPQLLTRVPVYPEIKYGDEVLLLGKIMATKNSAPKDGAKAFDYESYLAKDGIYDQMFFPGVTIVSRNKGNIINEKLFALKEWLMKNISQNIPEPESSLAGGITLGTKQSLGDELLQKFRDTGVAHIVVLSGYNIAVVAGVISRLVLFMPFSIRLIMSALGIVLFSVMVGGGATVVRATVMALIVIVARVLGREGDALRALVLAGALMVFANPMILLHDVSFQLSFSATLALVTLVPILEKYFLFIPNKVFREIIVTTVSTQIFVLPLILYHMGSVSLIGLVTNIFILPVVPVAMLVVAFVAILGWIPLLGSSFSIIAYLILAYIFSVVNFFAEAPFAAIKNISFPLWALVLSYALLAMYLIKNFPRKTFPQKVEDEF